MHLPKPSTSTEMVGTPPGTVLPRRRPPRLFRSGLAGFASPLTAVVTIAVALVAPSPPGVLAEHVAVAVPAVAVPAVPSGLPPAIEALAPYVAQTANRSGSTTGTVQPAPSPGMPSAADPLPRSGPSTDRSRCRSFAAPRPRRSEHRVSAGPGIPRR